MSKYKSFEELKEARLKAYKGMVEGDVLGFLDQHTGFYPDPAHFIYELLQNAEDMEATNVTFRLFADKLIFEHDGTKRDFDLDDIDAITNKGKSPKADDPTQIGKFGMGFKAVYVYTNTPEIHSGVYDFKIENVIVPNDENVPKLAKKGFTQFIFPFDNPKKPAADAITEIKEEGFGELNETSLLFLSHIKTIRYYLPDGSEGCISIEDRIQNVHFLYAITVNQPNTDKVITYWARFSDDCPIMVSDKDSNSKAEKSFPVSIAYRLIKSEDDSFTLESSLAGKVCLFFPTEMDSLLRFHINAPFASTVARDVILSKGEDGEANEKLIGKLADLTAKSLHWFKKANMLDYAAYSVLPTLRDFDNQPNSRYKVFAIRIKEEFEKEELFITEKGQYRALNKVFRASKDIKLILPDEHLETIYGKYWIPSFLPANFSTNKERRIADFIMQFSIEEYTIEKFIDALDKDNKFFNDLFSAQTDIEYFKTLYALFAQSKEREQDKYPYSFLLYSTARTRNEILREVAFLFCEDKKLHSVQDNLFLKTDYQPKHYLKNPIYVDTCWKNTTQKDESIKKFLLSIGVREMSESVDIGAGLSYDNDSVLVIWLDILEQYKEKPDSILQYKDEEIFFARKSNDSTIFRVCAADCCWTKDIAFFYTDKYIFAEDCYSGINNKILEIKEIFIKLGGNVEPKIKKIYLANDYPLFSLLKTERERSKTCKRDDYTIDEFNWSKLNDIKAYSLKNEALILWKLVLRYNNQQSLHIYYKANKSASKQNNLESSLVYYLKRIAWVPTKSGEFKCPYELTEDDLLDEYKYEQQSILLAEISKKPNDAVERLKNKGVQDANMLAFAGLDFDVQEKALAIAAQMQEQKRKTGKSLSELASTSDREQLPEDDDDDYGVSHKPKNLEKRRIKLEKEFDDRETPVIPLRKLQFVLEKPDPEEKEFVNHEYKSHCQICGEEGILTAKGKRYFEAINIFNTGKLDDSLKIKFNLGWNTLCLCPNCAAKFKYSQLTISGLIEQVEKIDISTGQSEFEISIVLENKPSTIRFTPNHLLALQVAIKKIKTIEQG
ncbi:MAG: hypothetical protein IJ811_04400 [Clostridia bacterium]|nr:hypothetical protein [Clostridia bacterium]